jgi:hypothetical protein
MKRRNSNQSDARRWSAIIVFSLAWISVAGCGRDVPPSDPQGRGTSPEVRGKPIAASSSTNAARAATNAPFVPADYSKPDRVENGLIQLGWDKLSGFKFDVYEVSSVTNVGRALIKSDDTIPAPMKAYDGRQVAVSGFILPLRTKRGLVTEFLLLRDQGTCCFGAQAQINHFLRVKFPTGIQHGDPVPWKVSGTIRVGEIYIQGYLTGIYQMEAESAVEVKER